MANMFSGNQEKKIPKNFKDCYKTDSITKNLWLWCERLEKWGKFLFWVLIVGGLILSISTSIVEKEVVVREATYWSEAETELRKTLDFEIFIPLLLETALYAFLEYCAYHVIALLVGSLATIVQHTKITANITLYNSAKVEGVVDDYEENNMEDNDEKFKKKPVKVKSSEEIKEDYDLDKKTVFCKHCGAVLSEDVEKCHVCNENV